MGYLDDLIEQLSAPDAPGGIIFTRDPGGVPVGICPSITTQLFEEIEDEIGLAEEHRDEFREAVQKAVRVCWDLEGRRQRAVRYADLVKRLKSIEKTARAFANELRRLSMSDNAGTPTPAQASREISNQLIRDHLDGLLRKEVSSWVEAGKTQDQGKTSAASKRQADIPQHEAVFSSLHGYAISPAEDVAKACCALLTDLERTKPPRGRPRNEAINRFARRVSAALKEAELQHTLKTNSMSDVSQRTGPLLIVTQLLRDHLPHEALPGSDDSYRDVAIEEALYRAVNRGRNSTQS